MVNVKSKQRWKTWQIIFNFVPSFLDELLLYPPEKYYYLRQSGCIQDPSINDKADFQEVLVRSKRQLDLRSLKGNRKCQILNDDVDD